MLSNQLRTIEDTLDLLKRVEVMEESESSQRTFHQASNHNQNAPRQMQNGPRDGRVQNQRQVRQTQIRNQRSNHSNWRRDRNQEERSTPLNPNAPAYQESQQQAGNSGN
jgi:hypothetical protein